MNRVVAQEENIVLVQTTPLSAGRAILIWGLASLFYFYDNLLQLSPSAMKSDMFSAFVSTAEEFGSLSAYCLYAYGLMQIPAGILLDRFGPRKIITIACLFCALGSLMFGEAQGLWEAKLGRVMIGIGAAFAFVSCLKIASDWFDTKRFALMTGLTVTVGFLGSVVGLSTVNSIVSYFGWRHSMQLGGFIGIALSIVLWLVIRDRGSRQSSVQTAIASEKIHIGAGLLKVLKSKQTWIAAMYAGLMFVPTLAFGALWGVQFLIEAHGFDQSVAGSVISLIFIGWIFGCPLWGAAADYLGRRNLPMFCSSILTLLICIAIIYGTHTSLFTVNLLMFSLGFVSSGFLLSFVVIRESHPAYTVGIAMGFANAINTLWGAVAQPMIGKILDFISPLSTLQNGERVFSVVEYQQALLVLPVCVGIALIMLFFLKETMGKAE